MPVWCPEKIHDTLFWYSRKNIDTVPKLFNHGWDGEEFWWSRGGFTSTRQWQCSWLLLASCLTKKHSYWDTAAATFFGCPISKFMTLIQIHFPVSFYWMVWISQKFSILCLPFSSSRKTLKMNMGWLLICMCVPLCLHTHTHFKLIQITYFYFYLMSEIAKSSRFHMVPRISLAFN